MIESILFYGLLVAVMAYFGFQHNRRTILSIKHGHKPYFLDANMWIVFIVFSVFAGIRYNVGVDYLSYHEQYLLASKNIGELDIYKSNNEWLFYYLEKFCIAIGFHYSVFFTVIAFIQIFCLYYAVRKQSYLFIFIPIVLIGGRYFLCWMNGMRQEIAICFFFVASAFFIEKKYIKSSIGIIISVLFHHSALIAIPFILLAKFNIFRNRALSLILIVLAFFLGQTPYVINNLDSLSAAIDFFGYGRFDDYVTSLKSDQSEALGLGPRNLSFLLIYLLITYYSEKMKAFYKENIHYFSFYNFTVLNGIMYLLFLNTSHLFIRVAMFFDCFTIATTAYLLYYLSKTKKTAIQIFVLLIAITFMIVSIFADSSVPHETTLYKVFF